MSSIDKINQYVDSIEDEILEWQRYFHMNPELGFKEYNTSQYIYDILNQLDGFEVTRPVKTGVVGILKGNKKGKTIAFRADIDALPMQERNIGEYVSKVDNVMHACGHDGHTAMLLGAAKVLSNMKNEINGEVRFIFQPAEEVPPGGAKAMIEARVLEDVDYIFGVHLDAIQDVGTFGVKSGPIMSNTNNFEIEIIGSGGHAAFPEQSVDTVYVASQIVVALQGILPRNFSAFNRAVITTTNFEASDAYNIIPKYVKIGGTVRILDPECEEELTKRMEEVVKGICAMNRATYNFKIIPGYNILTNDDELSNHVYNTLRSIVGEDNIYEDIPVMGGEDFSAYLKSTKGCFYKVGGRKEKDGIVYPHHNSMFEINDKAYSIGTKGCVNVIINALNGFINI